MRTFEGFRASTDFAIGAFSLCLLLVVGSAAQSEPPHQSTDSVPKFTARTEMVVVPVLVLRHGEHVAGLRPDDFAIEDDGVRKTIASFEEIGNSASSVSSHTAVESINDAPAANSSSKVLVLDFVNTPLLSQEFAKRKLLDFLQHDFIPNRPTMLVVMRKSGLQILHDFTGDRAVLASVLQELTTESRGAALDNPKAPEGPSIRYQLDVADEYDGVQREIEREMSGRESAHDALTNQATLAGLRQLLQLGQTLANISGVKTVVWATAGFRLPDLTNKTAQTIGELYKLVLQQFGTARASIYSVDVREDTPMSVFPSAENMNPPPPGAGLRLGTVGPAQTFMDIAQRTGSAYCVLHKDPNACFRRAVDYGSRYYVLTFYAAPSDRLQWHKLQVSVRGDRLQVKSRSGYYAAGPNPGSAQQSPKDVRPFVAEDRP